MLTELHINCRKLNTSPTFITQSQFRVLKEISLVAIQYIILIIPKKRESQQTENSYAVDIDSKGP